MLFSTSNSNSKNQKIMQNIEDKLSDIVLLVEGNMDNERAMETIKNIEPELCSFIAISREGYLIENDYKDLGAPIDAIINLSKLSLTQKETGNVFGYFCLNFSATNWNDGDDAAYLLDLCKKCVKECNIKEGQMEYLYVGYLFKLAAENVGYTNEIRKKYPVRKEDRAGYIDFDMDEEDLNRFNVLPVIASMFYLYNHGRIDEFLTSRVDYLATAFMYAVPENSIDYLLDDLSMPLMNKIEEMRIGLIGECVDVVNRHSIDEMKNMVLGKKKEVKEYKLHEVLFNIISNGNVIHDIATLSCVSEVMQMTNKPQKPPKADPKMN